MNKTSIALGNFDGVHMGHRAIIGNAVSFAGENNLKSVVYTFENHPNSFFGKNTDGFFLTDNNEKNEIFKSIGVDEVRFEDFGKVKDMTPEEFCEKILIKELNCAAAFCGKNYRFGKNGSGDADALCRIMEKNGAKVFIEDFVSDSGRTVSSTLIRSLLSEGKTLEAARLLKRPFSICGKVIHGEALGRKLGFPTINQLYPTEKAVLAFGVYAAVCTIDGKNYPGVANVGIKPTVTHDKNAPVLCETHIIDFEGDVYGKNVKISFYKMLRSEKRFANLDELTAEVRRNTNQTRDYFKETGYVFE